MNRKILACGGIFVGCIFATRWVAEPRTTRIAPDSMAQQRLAIGDNTLSNNDQVQDGDSMVDDGNRLVNAPSSVNMLLPTESMDTPFFVFTPYVHDPLQQGHGTMHKVGVHSIVAQAYPQLLQILPDVLNSNAERDTSLLANGVTPKLAFRFWKLIVQNAYVGDDGVLRVEVLGTTGARVCGGFSDGRVAETWKVVSNQLVLETRQASQPNFVSNNVGSWDGSVGYDTTPFGLE